MIAVSADRQTDRDISILQYYAVTGSGKQSGKQSKEKETEREGVLRKKGKQADCMRQMADNVAGTRGLGNVSWNFDGHYHRDLLREKKESEKEGRERVRKRG